MVKRGYRSRNNLVNVEKGDLVKHSHSILTRRKTHFSQLLIHGIYDDRQTEIHTAKLIVPEPSAFEI
jgi:hypothetical protein